MERKPLPSPTSPTPIPSRRPSLKTARAFQSVPAYPPLLLETPLRRAKSESHIFPNTWDYGPELLPQPNEQTEPVPLEPTVSRLGGLIKKAKSSTEKSFRDEDSLSEPETEEPVWSQGPKPEILLISVPALLDRFFAFSAQDKVLCTQFLLVHTLHIPSLDLMLKILELSRAGGPWVQLTHASLVGRWIKFDPILFRSEPLRGRLREFCALLSLTWPDIAQELKSKPRRKLHAIQRRIRSCPAPLVPTQIRSVLDIPPLELARQLTLMIERVFVTCATADFLSGEKRTGGAQGLGTASNLLVRFVATSVCAEPNLKKRVKVVAYWIQALDRLEELRNFAGMLDVYLGLSHRMVARLTKTWKKLPAKADMRLQHVRLLFSTSDNFAQYRRSIKHAARRSEPYLPAPPIFLKDLLFMDEGNPTYGPEPPDWLNWAKFSMMAKYVKALRHCQQHPYSIHPVPSIQQYIEENTESETTIRTYSMAAEDLRRTKSEFSLRRHDSLARIRRVISQHN
jgi:hypothetical protein